MQFLFLEGTWAGDGPATSPLAAAPATQSCLAGRVAFASLGTYTLVDSDTLVEEIATVSDPQELSRIVYLPEQ